jgi:manganese/zinc/iron transport system substrate-binding protein
VLVTAHDAFGYFASAYDFEVHGIQGISTESEASVRDVNALVDLLVSRRIPAVFVESSVPARTVEALVEGAKARGHAVRIGGELFSDAMGAPGTPEGTYVGMVRHNVSTIVAALSEPAP